jgi:hypothetical protein
VAAGNKAINVFRINETPRHIFSKYPLRFTLAHTRGCLVPRASSTFLW